MRIIIVDDEPIAAESLARMILKVEKDGEINIFNDPQDALDYISLQKDEHIEIAFLDIEMVGMTGIQLAKAIKEISKETNIIFVTGYSQYAVDAFSLHASGYLLKPTTKEDIEREISNLRIPIPKVSEKRIHINTFGNFEVFVDGKPLSFKRAKSKELLAYLVDRKGAGVTAAEGCGILWEDKEYDFSLQRQYQTVISELIKSLKEFEADSIIIRKRNNISIDMAEVDCDYYNFLKGEVFAVNSYVGEYMNNYSWAEFTTGFLSRGME